MFECCLFPSVYFCCLSLCSLFAFSLGKYNKWVIRLVFQPAKPAIPPWCWHFTFDSAPWNAARCRAPTFSGCSLAGTEQEDRYQTCHQWHHQWCYACCWLSPLSPCQDQATWEPSCDYWHPIQMVWIGFLCKKKNNQTPQSKIFCKIVSNIPFYLCFVGMLFSEKGWLCKPPSTGSLVNSCDFIRSLLILAVLLKASLQHGKY